MEELAAPDGAGAGDYALQAVPKGGRMDLLVEKATEVGATRIVPVLAERGVVNPRGGKVGRWRRVAEAAARQALRLGVPMWPSPYDSRTPSWRWKGTGILLHNAPALRPVEAVVGVPASLFVGRRAGGARASCDSLRRLASVSADWVRTGSAARPQVSSRWRVRWLHWRAGSNVRGGGRERGRLHIL